VTLPELVLFILGTLMVGSVFGWIVACLVRCSREERQE